MADVKLPDAATTNGRVRLNIGAGDTTIPGYIPWDIKDGKEAYPLPFRDGEVDAIYACHILEHYHHSKVPLVLREWERVLRPGGLLQIAVPDIRRIVDMDPNQQNYHLRQFFLFGGELDKHDHHGTFFTREELHAMFVKLGFEHVQDFSPFVNDNSIHPFSLNLQGLKRQNFKISNTPKIVGVQTLPRLTFTENAYAIYDVLSPLGIKVIRDSGAFWDKGVSCAIEQAMKDDPDYILIIDFDTAFTKDHLTELLRIMQENPDVAAVWPVQISRHDRLPLCYKPNLDYTTEITQATYGHFGFTLIRGDVFKHLPHPWFFSLPDAVTGKWSVPTISDADITFWRGLDASGYKVVQANRVVVGHMMLAVRWPTDDGSACYQPVQNWTQTKRPPSNGKFNPIASRNAFIKMVQKAQDDAKAKAAPADNKIVVKVDEVDPAFPDGGSPKLVQSVIRAAEPAVLNHPPLDNAKVEPGKPTYYEPPSVTQRNGELSKAASD